MCADTDTTGEGGSVASCSAYDVPVYICWYSNILVFCIGDFVYLFLLNSS